VKMELKKMNIVEKVLIGIKMNYRSDGVLQVSIENSGYLYKVDQRSLIDSTCKIVHNVRGNPSDSSTIVILYDGNIKIAAGIYFPPYIVDVEMTYY